MRRKRKFTFRKRIFNVEGTSIDDMTYNTIADTKILKHAAAAAREANCEIVSIKDHSWWFNGKVIVIKCHREEYKKFATTFCMSLEDYIKDIEYSVK